MNFSYLVYVMCALTSILCAVLLLITYLKNQSRFLLGSVLCFLGLAINNILLFTDLVLLPETDLSFIRITPSILGFSAMIWGFIWETQ